MGRRMRHDQRGVEPAVGSASQRDEAGILTQRKEYGIHAGFHHLLGANRLEALVFKEMSLQERECFFAIPSLGLNGG